MSKLLLIIILMILPALVFAEQLTDCGNNKQALALSKLIVNDKEQKRMHIRCNRLLTEAAVAKAKTMVEFGIVAHNLKGSPNSHLRASNYKLPEHYGSDFNSNQVEAVAGGYSDADKVWDAFKRSEAHRTHLLGEHEFYLEQDEIGIAFIKEWESPHVEYWVVYLTKGYQKNQYYSGKLTDIPNKNLLILQQEKSKKNLILISTECLLLAVASVDTMT